jgi:predicted phosphodiesterase
MLVALLTDTHAGARNNLDILHTFFDKFYSDVFFPYLQENNIQKIIHLGDMFEKRSTIDFATLYKTREYLFDKFYENDLSVDVIVGNHDCRFKSTNQVNSPNLLLQDYIKSGHVRVFSEPTEVTLDNTKIVYMPWICQNTYDKSMDMLKNSTANILLGHLEVSGFEMYRGSVHHGGTPASLFSNFCLVCSGHFHHRSTKGNISYLGSPYETCWSDYNDPRGFHILDTDTLELTFIENPNRLFHKIPYDDSEHQNTEFIANMDFSNYTDCYVKVIVDKKTNPHWFELFIEKLEKSSPIDVQIIDDSLSFLMDETEEIDDTVEDTLSILTRTVEVADVKVDKSKLSDLFISLYNEAKHME